MTENLPAPLEHAYLTEDVLKEYGIESNKDQADFLRAFEYTVHLSTNHNATEAAAMAGINRRSLYTERWKNFINIAAIIIRQRSIQDVQQITSYVHNEWPRIIRATVEVATGPDLRLRTEAAKFLWEAYVQPFEGQTKEESKEKKYLQEQRDFNPAKAILKELMDGGAKITIESQPPNIVIDSEIVSQDG